MNICKRKLVVVGDASTGKTALLRQLAWGEIPPSSSSEHHMNLTGNCLANIKIEETCVELGLWDTISSDQYERLRPFAYKDAHIIIITLAVDNPSSLESVYEKWLPEVASFSKGAPVLLVGSKIDLRQCLSQTLTLEAAGQMPLTIAQGKEMATKIGAVAYMECSALTGCGIRSILEKAAREAKEVRTKSRRRRVECIVG